jgi:tetratricopeptide (TPR) repeat protein
MVHAVRALFVTVVIGCGLLTAAGSARAAPQPAPGRAEARADYQRGKAAYDHGAYDEAIAAFTRAHDRDPAPILLFNIAQSHWKKGEAERALSFYRQYLQEDPSGAERGRAETRIRELEAAQARGREESARQDEARRVEATRREMTAPVATGPAAGAAVLAVPARVAPLPSVLEARAEEEPQRRPVYRRPWFWAAIGGLALGAAAVAVAARAGGAETWTCGDGCRFGTIMVKN